MKQCMNIRRRDGVTQRYRVGKAAKPSVAKKSGQETLKFYDLKTKKSFTTDEYKIVVRGNRRSAVATTPSGIPAWRAMKKA